MQMSEKSWASLKHSLRVPNASVTQDANGRESFQLVGLYC